MPFGVSPIPAKEWDSVVGIVAGACSGLVRRVHMTTNAGQLG